MVAPVAAAPTAPPASVAVVPSVAPVAVGLGISLALDNVGKAGAVESSVEEASVEETRGVGGGVGVDATVDGAGVDSAQTTVEEDLGLGLSLTLAPPTAIAAPPATIAAATPATIAPVAIGLSISITLDNVGKAGAVESSVEKASVPHAC